MKKFAIILSGSGVYDGSEIHEATMTMLAIKEQGADYGIFAPDIDQHHVINHLTGEEMNEKRNVLIESARIARGDIKSLAEYDAGDFDALILPGGFGAAKNLCDYAFNGPECEVNDAVAAAIRQSIDQKKPIGALCIAPVILAKVIGEVELTIGQDETTAGHVETMGATHKQTGHGEVVVDTRHKIFTTPCYMLDANIVQIAEGARNVVKAMMEEIV